MNTCITDLTTKYKAIWADKKAADEERIRAEIKVAQHIRFENFAKWVGSWLKQISIQT